MIDCGSYNGTVPQPPELTPIGPTQNFVQSYVREDVLVTSSARAGRFGMDMAMECTRVWYLVFGAS